MSAFIFPFRRIAVVQDDVLTNAMQTALGKERGYSLLRYFNDRYSLRDMTADFFISYVSGKEPLIDSLKKIC